MKWNKKLKKIILGSTGFAMAAVIFFVGSMQSMNEVAARVRVFDKITEKYPAGGDKEMKILEIVPYADTTVNNGQTVSAYSEFGYFLKNKKDDNSSLIATTHGTLLSNGADSVTADKYPSALFQLRTYGLIRPSGSDAGKTYPIYMLKDGQNGGAIAAFLNYQATNYKLYEDDEVYVKGVYSSGAGGYQLADGYKLNEDGTICKIEEVVVSGNGVVSGNDVVSGNEIETKLIPVTDIDMSKQQLPTSTGGFAYITKVAEGAGNLIFTRSETSTQMTEYYGISDQALYYSVYGTPYFGSSDYFREFVLGDRKAYANNNITYNTKQASAVTVKEVQEADLIYISGKSVAFSSSEASDLTEAVMLEIYNQEVLNHKAVMMDYACYSADSDSNVSKLATLLWRESQSDIKSSYPDAYKKNADGTVSNDLYNLEFMKGDALKDLQDSMMTGANGNFVKGNLYVYNHHLSDFDNPKSLIDAGDVFANGDFNTPYKASVTQTGFAEVMAYITSTNKVSTTGTMPASVSPAVAIQYILISDGNPLTVMKSSLHVLEIQPVTSFLFNEKRGSDEYAYIVGTAQADNRDNFIKNYLGNYYDDKHDYIMFTSMTIDEFNGRNEDLVETYDVIYIGSEMGDLYKLDTLTTKKIKDGYYTQITDDDKASLPTYTDTNMNGMVYYNIGDLVTTKDRTGNDLYDHIKSFESRYNGRDLTKDKLEKLKLYLKADGLVLVAGDLMATDANGNVKINPTQVFSEGDKVDHGRVDTSSNMYELLAFSQGGLFDWENSGTYQYATKEGKAYTKYSNLVSVGDFATGIVAKADIEKYIATEKLALTMIDAPNEYAYEYMKDANGNATAVLDPNSIVYMEEDSDGSRELSYDFVISSLSGIIENEGNYIPSLYIDVNKDGKYSKTAENIRDIQIVVKATGAEAPRDAENNYLLSKDVEYRMTRELDSQYSGYLQWKLNIRSVLDPLVHASEEGSTVVKNQGTDKEIHILQINKNSGSSLDLETEATSDTSKFKTYLENVPGYQVTIKSVTTTEFTNQFNTAYTNREETSDSVEEFAQKFFNQYILDDKGNQDPEDDVKGVSMLVLGYGDNYESMADANALRALKSFVESEKPVLMAHDFMVYYAAHAQSTFLRHQMGVDKYGVTLNIETDDGITAKDLVSKLYYTGNGRDYLHTGIGYNRTKTTVDKDAVDQVPDSDKVKLIESTGKTVAYTPSHATLDSNSKVVDNARSMTDGHTQGISNYSLGALSTGTSKWLYSDKVTHRNSDDLAVGRGSYIAEKINNGQITSYPYLLPNDLNVEHTHAQHLELDLDADDDNDGETDVVVWYALGEKTVAKGSGSNTAEYIAYNAYSDDAAGPVPADGYYVYNKGNITYTGYGDNTEYTSFTDDEAQLFVNILFAAFGVTQTEPSAGFFETPPTATSEPITGLSIPYDENVTGENIIDSSILKNASGAYRHPFVNPNGSPTALREGVDITNATPIYYRLNDTNFVRGQKYITVEYYLKPEGNGYDEANREYTFDNGKLSDGNTIDDLVLPVTEVNVDDVTMPLVDISKYITTYQVSEGRFASVVPPTETKDAEGKVVSSELSMMESGVTYGFYLPMSLLNEDTRYTIYIKSKTRVVTKSSQTGKPIVDDIPGEGFSEFTVTKADLLDLD